MSEKPLLSTSDNHLPQELAAVASEPGYEKEVLFERVSKDIMESGFNFHAAEHDALGRDPKTFHSSEHPHTLYRRAEQMAEVLHLTPKERALTGMGIAYHDTIIEYDAADPNNLLGMIRRHRGAREGDQPKGKDGNEGRSSRLLEAKMRQANKDAGEELYSEEDIQTAIWEIDATYPEPNLGPDFSGAEFEKDPYFQIAVDQNPELGELFLELQQENIVKGPLFSQPHLEKALEEGRPVPRPVLMVALMDLGAAGLGKKEEFFEEGDDEMQEIYGNLRNPETLQRLVTSDNEEDRANRTKTAGAFLRWAQSQEGFAAWQALRFEKIVHLLKRQNGLTPDEELGMRAQFSHYADNVRAARDRAKELTENVAKITQASGEKEAFRYLAGAMGYTFEDSKEESRVA